MKYELEVGVTGRAESLVIACGDWLIGLQKCDAISHNVGSLGLFRVEAGLYAPDPNYILLAHFAAGGWTHFCIRCVIELVNKDDPTIRQTIKAGP